MAKQKKGKTTKVSGRMPKFEDGARPGDILERTYHDKVYKVAVKDDGFHFNGTVYTSLSKIASSLTKASTNGPLWFGLRAAEEKPAAKKPAKKAAKGRKAAAPKAAPAPEAAPAE